MPRPSLLFSIPLLLIAGVFGWISVFGAHMPYIEWDPEDLAEYLVEHDRSPEECWDLILLDPFGPPFATRRAACVYHYAEIAADPAACLQLLPSEYSLSCLSEVGGKVFSGRPCTGTLGKNEVHCNEKYSEGELLIDNPQIQNCLLYQRKDLREWCHYTRTFRMTDVYECSAITHPVQRDDCETNYAFKKKDVSLCQTVVDEKRRQFCEVRINTWLEYPALRNSFYFGNQIDESSSSRSSAMS